MTPEAILNTKGPGFILKTALLAFSVVVSKETKDFTSGLDAYWHLVKATHDVEEAERLAEIEREKTCDCSSCVEKRGEKQEEEKRKKEEEEAEERRRRQDEDDDGYAADGFSDYD